MVSVVNNNCNLWVRVYYLPIVTLILLAVFNHDIVSASSVGQETLVAVVGRDFVMMGADTSSVQSIVVTSSDRDKIQVVSSGGQQEQHGGGATIAVAAAGDLADVNHLLATLKSHASIGEYENSLGGDIDIINMAASSQPQLQLKIPTTSTSIGLSVSNIANLARTEISQRVRSNAPYRVGLLVAGMQPTTAANRQRSSSKIQTPDLASASSLNSNIAGDVQQQLQRVTPEARNSDKTSNEMSFNNNDENVVKFSPCLYWLDEYGALQNIRYASHGMASNFLNAILDRNYHPDLSRDEAAALIQSCFRQLQTRYVINSPKPPLIKCIDAEHGCRIYQQTNIKEISS